MLHNEVRNPQELQPSEATMKSGAAAGVDADTDRSMQLAQVQALGFALVAKRKEAQDARAKSGIEDDWLEDEQFYQSIDQANPEGETNVAKPTSPSGASADGSAARAAPVRSSVFIPITRAYVDAASARVGDMLLPTDDSPWAIKPTPVATTDQPNGQGQPEQPPSPLTPTAGAVGMLASSGPQMGAPPQPSDIGNPTTPPAMPGMPGMPPPGPPQGPPPVDAGKSEAEIKAEAATKIITDWHIECQWHAEVRKVIEDSALLGTGILKGPFPVARKSYRYVTDPTTGQGMVQEFTEFKPVSKRIRPQNFWPSPDAGEDVQNGSYCWEFDRIGSRAVQKLLDDPTYITEMVMAVLKEGPEGAWADAPDDAEQNNAVGTSYPIWYFYGDVDQKMLMAAGIPADMFDDPELENVSIPAMVTIINDKVVRASFNPLENGGFPYDVMPWQRRTGIIWGKGVARQIRTPQRILNANVRADMDNGGLTVGPQWAVRRKWIKPLTGGYSLAPLKGWEMTEDAPESAKIGDAISFTNIESNEQSMANRIQRALKFAEDATGLPMLMQGQQGSAPDTVGGMTILNNNGSTVLRRIARLFDDCVTERHIRRYYFWLLENKGNDHAKGDFQIDARGSTALVERDLQNQAFNQMAPLLMQHPDVHPGRLAEEMMKANRLDPKRVMLTDAEKKARDSQPPPPPLPLMIQEAKEKGLNERHGKDLELEALLLQKSMKDAERDHEYRLAELAAKMGMSTDALKNALARDVLKLRTQVDLSNQQDTKEALTAPSEPAGRAKNGEAFQA